MTGSHTITHTLTHTSTPSHTHWLTPPHHHTHTDSHHHTSSYTNTLYACCAHTPAHTHTDSHLHTLTQTPDAAPPHPHTHTDSHLHTLTQTPDAAPPPLPCHCARECPAICSRQRLHRSRCHLTAGGHDGCGPAQVTGSHGGGGA